MFSEKNKIIANTSESPSLYIDESSIHQVFYNLLYNAVRYSFKGRPITIYYEKDLYYPYWHKYKIQNFGIGIEEADEEKIFDVPHFRSQKAKEMAPAGSGYGLKVCKQIIEKHLGKIRVTQLNNPTEFTVYFPDFLEKRKINETDGLEK